MSLCYTYMSLNSIQPRIVLFDRLPSQNRRLPGAQPHACPPAMRIGQCDHGQVKSLSNKNIH